MSISLICDIISFRMASVSGPTFDVLELDRSALLVSFIALCNSDPKLVTVLMSYTFNLFPMAINSCLSASDKLSKFICPVSTIVANALVFASGVGILIDSSLWSSFLANEETMSSFVRIVVAMFFLRLFAFFLVLSTSLTSTIVTLSVLVFVFILNEININIVVYLDNAKILIKNEKQKYFNNYLFLIIVKLLK